MPKKHPSRNVPAKQKVLAGCYIDFEGFAGNEYRTSPPPVLIGIFNQNGSGEFKQVVFTNDYRWAAEQPGVDHEVLFCSDRDAFLKDLADSAKMSKPLFAFSEHELNVIEKHVGHKITKRYRNVRTIAKRWLNTQGDNYPKPQSFALRDVTTAMGIKLQSKLPEGGVTSRLRDVRDYSSSAKNWSAAPAQIKKKWHDVLEHNRSDVMAIYEMMLRMRP